ncbi:MAG: hypothetical protein FD146_463 [Anaerolineaceae bacterium]|nr:MAG: hypothetical protein FD146_463 [Anaerolineaceae bacterium]
MNVFLDGLSELGRNAGAILLFFSASLGAGVWLARLFPGGWKEQAWLLVPFGLAAGLVPLALLSMLFALLGWLWPPILKIGHIGMAALAVSGLLAWIVRERKRVALGVPAWAGALGGLALFLLLVVRLAFLEGLLLPPYSDGAAHYLMARDLLAPASAPQGSHALVGLLQRYYHFGFHGLAAWLVSVTGLPLETALPLLGQLFLVIAPLAALFLSGVTTGSRKFAAFAFLLAAIGWKMPAFASNWAKYPTAAGLALLPVTLGALYLLWKSGRRRPAAWIGAALLAAGVGIFHARTLVCLLVAGACFLLVRLLDRFAPKKILPWLAAAAGLLAGYALVSQQYLMQFYCGGQCYALGAAALLAPFAILYAPGLSLGIFLYLAGTIGASKLHLPEALRSYSVVWLDGPFLEVACYLPLAFLGGLGIAGLLGRLEAWPRRLRPTVRAWVRRAVTALIVLLVFWNVTRIDTFRPSSCCNYVHAADLAAIRWIGENTPPDAVVYVSGYKTGGSRVAMDGGMWVTALAGRRSIVEEYDYTWDTLEMLRLACAQGDVYVYAGGAYYSFEMERFNRPDWYDIVFAEGPVAIYHVSGCIGGK